MAYNQTLSADIITIQLANYISDKGITIASLSKRCHIPPTALYTSLSAKARSLRAGELIKICRFLDVDPMKFFEAS